MPPRRRGSSGFRGARARPKGTFYMEIRAVGFRVTLGTFTMPELATRAYEAAAWRFRRPRRDLNFQDVESLEEAEFLVPAPRLVSEEDSRRHRQVKPRIAIAEHDEELMRQWREQFHSNVDNTEAFFADLRAQRRSSI
ncbi:AP2/ERF and B3 domain-containing transcription factor ARF14-like [Lolium perenne]|uniref:AP2/ERF and B3 domain-containing transcription factor ARF14-like n=1 Tax=Lolium perenne TaxID=4522 RepID=UPI0021F4FF07|nr:AP2/ERF and B3 domain-containing transcription factor ARF14-like [Lolium perenne]